MTKLGVGSEVRIEQFAVPEYRVEKLAQPRTVLVIPGTVSGGGGSGGDVDGPASATNNNLAAYDGTTGKLLKDSGLATSAVATLTGTQTLTNKTLTSPVINSPTGITASDVGAQPLDSDLTTLAGLTATTNNFIVSVASAWASRTPAQVKTTLAIVVADIADFVSSVASAITTERTAAATYTNKDLSSGTNTFPTFNQSTTGSAATLTTSRTIGILTGDVTSAGSGFNGSANNSNAATLATVNSNVGSFGSASQVSTLTVNGKGLVTAAGQTSISITASQVSDFSSAADARIAAASATGTGSLVRAASPALTGNPTAPTQTAGNNSTRVATTAYADDAAGTVNTALTNHVNDATDAHDASAISFDPVEGWGVATDVQGALDEAGLLATAANGQAANAMTKNNGGQEIVAAASGTSGTVTLNCGNANIFTLTPTGNVTTLTISSVPATGVGVTISLIVSQGATPRTIATPTGGIFLGAATPTQVANKVCLFEYLTVDGGATWLCTAQVQV